MKQRFHRALASPHHSSNLGVWQPLDELQSDKALLLERQGGNSAPELTDELEPLDTEFDFGRLQRIEERPEAAAVAVPVRDEIVSDAIEPGGKRHTLICVSRQVGQRLNENFGGHILSFKAISNSGKYVAENAIGVALVQVTECRDLLFRALN